MENLQSADNSTDNSAIDYDAIFAENGYGEGQNAPVNDPVSEQNNAEGEANSEGDALKNEENPEAKTLEEEKPEEGKKPEDQKTSEKPTKDAPISWRADLKEKFKELPEDVKTFILKREEDIHRQFTQNDTYRQMGREIDSIIHHHADIIQDGVQATSIVKELMDVASILVKGSPEQKANLLIKEAEKQGIDLGAYLQHQARIPKEYKELQEQNQHLKDQLTQYNNSVMMQVQTQAYQTVDSMLEDTVNYPYANEVIQDMIPLVSTGMSLDDAYKKACRLNDDVFSRVQKDAELKKNQKSQQQALKAKQASFTVRDSGTSINPHKKMTEAEENQYFHKIAEEFGLKD